jgi:hypothetical protein
VAFISRCGCSVVCESSRRRIKGACGHSCAIRFGKASYRRHVISAFIASCVHIRPYVYMNSLSLSLSPSLTSRVWQLRGMLSGWRPSTQVWRPDGSTRRACAVSDQASFPPTQPCSSINLSIGDDSRACNLCSWQPFAPAIEQPPCFLSGKSF